MAGVIRGEATVREAYPQGHYRVEFANGHQAMAHFPKKMQVACIPLLPGEKVVLEMSAYDLSRGRIALGQPSPASEVALEKE